MDLEPFLVVFKKVPEILAKTAKFWIPISLLYLGWKLWVSYVREQWLSSVKWVLLEIRVPKEVFKSPAAMELALSNALSQGGGVGNNYQMYWQGRVINWFSLEIVSLGGEIHFLIRTPAGFRRIIETQIYAQYPQAEIFEVSDYVEEAIKDMHKREWSLWGTEFKLTKEDPYPIKTYVDYGLDKSVGSTEENQKIDPITPMIEWMGAIGPNEQVWFQIVVRVSKWTYRKPGLMGGYTDYQQKTKDILKELKEKFEPTGDDQFKRLAMTEEDKMAISAINRTLNKQGFDCGIRAIYLAPKENFDGMNITGLTGIMKQYNSFTLNGFKPDNTTDVTYPWQDPTGVKKVQKKREMLDAYAQRSWFYPPYVRPHFVLTSEELATIFHFPGRVSETPSLGRIESNKSEPPTNLPI
ncbi:MAG: hypothetical protein QG580_207 [Patescibacteria group bacterium]|nr:hypothetical protein [Patescibacteria group bacterium]